MHCRSRSECPSHKVINNHKIQSYYVVYFHFFISNCNNEINISFRKLVSKQKDGKCGYNRETKEILWQNQRIVSTSRSNGSVNEKKFAFNSSRNSSLENLPFQETRSLSKSSSNQDNFKSSTPFYPEHGMKLPELPESPTNKDASLSNISFLSDDSCDKDILDSHLASIYCTPPPCVGYKDNVIDNNCFDPVQHEVSHDLPLPGLGASTPLKNDTVIGTGKRTDIPEQVHIKCLNMLRVKPLGTPLNEFQIAYENENGGVPLNYKRYGYTNLKDCLSSMTSTMTLGEDSRRNVIVSPTLQFCEEWATQIKAKQKAISMRNIKNGNENISNSVNVRKNSKKTDLSPYTGCDIRNQPNSNLLGAIPKVI